MTPELSGAHSKHPPRRARRGAAVVGCCVGLLGAGCASGQHSATAQASPTAATANGQLPTGAARRALAAQYLAIARPGNRGLESAFDPLEDRDKNHLVAAKDDLRRAARVERTFDGGLLRITFPPVTEPVAQTLYRVNQARARLTAAAAASTSLPELHAYEPRLDAANRPVERAVRTIRRQLGLPPPPTS